MKPNKTQGEAILHHWLLGFASSAQPTQLRFKNDRIDKIAQDLQGRIMDVPHQQLTGKILCEFCAFCGLLLLKPESPANG